MTAPILCVRTAIVAVLAVCVLPLAAQETGEIDDNNLDTASEVFEQCMESFCGGM